VDAQFGLGLKYANSKGAAQDYLEAASWYLKAAAQSHSMAQFNLGIMYAKGQGVPMDDSKAAMWMRKAADQGDAAAQFNLGIRYYRACIEPTEAAPLNLKIEAYKWLHLSAVQGYHGSAAACERVTLMMTRDDVVDGNNRVAAFVAQNLATVVE